MKGDHDASSNSSLNSQLTRKNSRVTSPRSKTHKIPPEVKSILDISPLLLAEHMTSLEMELFRKIRPLDLAKLFKNPSPVILAITERFNKVSLWVATEIVTAKSLELQLAICKHFIKTAKLLLSWGNYQTCMQIHTAINCASVSRLKSLHEALPAKYKEILSKMDSFLSHEKNYKHYRSKANRVPALPILPILQRDITVISDCNPSMVDEFKQHINFVKWRMNSRVISDFCSTVQNSVPYFSYTTHAPILSYLLVVQPLDEASLYAYSTTVWNPRPTSPSSKSTRFINLHGKTEQSQLPPKEHAVVPKTELPETLPKKQPDKLSPRIQAIKLPGLGLSLQYPGSVDTGTTPALSRSWSAGAADTASDNIDKHLHETEARSYGNSPLLSPLLSPRFQELLVTQVRNHQQQRGRTASVPTKQQSVPSLSPSSKRCPQYPPPPPPPPPRSNSVSKSQTRPRPPPQRPPPAVPPIQRLTPLSRSPKIDKKAHDTVSQQFIRRSKSMDGQVDEQDEVTRNAPHRGRSQTLQALGSDDCE